MSRAFIAVKIGYYLSLFLQGTDIKSWEVSVQSFRPIETSTRQARREFQVAVRGNSYPSMSAIEEEVLGIGKKLEKLVEQGQAVCIRERSSSGVGISKSRCECLVWYLSMADSNTTAKVDCEIAYKHIKAWASNKMNLYSSKDHQRVYFITGSRIWLPTSDNPPPLLLLTDAQNLCPSTSLIKIDRNLCFWA